MSVELWEAYYRRGAIATCPTGPEGLDQEVRAAWVEFFSTLPEGARILDIGTGNGVVALIAAETAASRGLNWDIHAADLASIDPKRDVPDGSHRFAKVTFHPRVPTERLPFADASFDAVSGHHALEYSEPAAALAEIHRILKPGGNAQFILHHTDSLFVASARQSRSEADLVFTKTKVYRRLHRLVSMDQIVEGATQRADADLRTAIRELKAGLEEARKAGAGWVLAAALDGIQKLLTARKQLKPQEAGLAVDRAEAEMRHSVRRLNDLIEHARSDADMAEIEKIAAAVGFSLIERMPQFHAGNNIVGWQLQLHRA